MNSEELFKESKKYLPGGVSSPVRSYKPYPFFAKEGKGSKLYDVDGNCYIDYCLAYGPLILGHAHPEIVETVSEAIKKGTTYGVPTENEITLAKEIVNRVPCADMVRFVNSGGEATMSAIRLARGYTSKNKIVKFEGSYHGAHDYCLVKSGSGATTLPDSLGIPEDTTKNTLSVPFNDIEAIEELIKNEGENIACIIMEVVMGNIGCIEPKKGYLEFLRKITEENNIVLIFDEVITGFRVAKGGAQEYYNVKPDLVTYGKIIGGGFPMGVLAGKQEIMEIIAPNGPVYQAGTLNGNPISVQAGITSLNLLNDNFYKEINEKGDYLRKNIRDIVSDLNLDFQTVGLGSMFQLYFNSNEVLNYNDAKSSDSEKFFLYFKELLKQNVFIPPSQFECNFISISHSKEDLDLSSIAIRESLKNVFKK